MKTRVSLTDRLLTLAESVDDSTPHLADLLREAADEIEYLRERCTVVRNGNLEREIER